MNTGEPVAEVKIEQSKNPEKAVPELVYISLEPRFASVVFTVPHLSVRIPENPVADPPKKDLVITLKNNGWAMKDPDDPTRLSPRDFDAETEILSVEWFDDKIKGEELLQRRKELLEKFFMRILDGEKNVQMLRGMMVNAGLAKGLYLYRAIDRVEDLALSREGCKLVNHLDPSANFEN